MKSYALLFCLTVMLLSKDALPQTASLNESDESHVGTIKAIKDCDVCPEIVTIPSGIFLRGSKDGRSTELPVQQISVKSFLISRTEVTQGQWKAVMGSTPSSNHKCGESCPVDSVSWNDAQEYVKKLRELTGKEYRLPTEAEWEYAARAGTTSTYYWGNTASHENANYGSDECCQGLVSGRDQWEASAPVGQFPPNAFGLYDMLGNVSEWVEDVYHKNYFLAPGDGSAWVSGAPHEVLARVVRGGAWVHDPSSIRSASRTKAIIVEPSDSIGFRVARSL